MIRRSARWLVPVALASFLLAPLACTKRVLVDTGQFDATQKVLLTLKGDRSLKGKIAARQSVELREGDGLYRARVASVTEDSIRLENVLLLDEEGYRTVNRRLADSRLVVTPADTSRVLLRSDVEKVELIRFDPLRTARGLGFWGYSGALFLLVLGERS